MRRGIEEEKKRNRRGKNRERHGIRQ